MAIGFNCDAPSCNAIFPVHENSSGGTLSLLATECKTNCNKVTTLQGHDEDFMRKETKSLLEKGIIQESFSPWRAQAFVVHGTHKPRMVIDYSDTINKYTDHVDAYPIPRIEDILNKAAKFKYFSKIDLRSAYHQIPLKVEDRQYTAFEVNGKLYEFTRLPFGVTNAVPVFQRVIDKFMEENGLMENGSPYLDDIFIGGNTLEEHNRALEKFIKAASDQGITLNYSKCIFRTTKINSLGHILEDGNIKPDPERMRPLLEFPTPANAKELRRLLGFFAYNAKWISGYSNKVAPLLQCLKQNCFPLPQEETDIIKDLKKQVAHSMLLVPRKEDGPLVLETDASGSAIGAVLSQNDRPIAYLSRSLSVGEQHQSVIEREAMAIVESFRKWSCYLKAFRTIVKTDQRSVSFIFSRNKSRIKNDKINRWRLEFSEYAFDIQYRIGTDNVTGDMLSRVNSIAAVPFLSQLHDSLAHPGVTRFWDYVKRFKLPYNLDNVKTTINSCQTCAELKPRFNTTLPVGRLVRSTMPFERLNIDIVGPKQQTSGGMKYILTVIDEYSRFPFPFPLREITTNSIIGALRQLFAIFGTPSFIHSDRGTQFQSKEFADFLLNAGISQSRTTPYHPSGNGQCERFNGTIWKAVSCLLHSRKLSQNKWNTVLPEALASIRGLLCTATNDTPHSRFFNFERRGTAGISLPGWLATGRPAYLRNFPRTRKDEPLVQRVTIKEVISPYHARVSFPGGRSDTVSTRDLSRCPEEEKSIGAESELSLNEDIHTETVDDTIALNEDLSLGTSTDTNEASETDGPDKGDNGHEDGYQEAFINEDARRRSTRTRRPPVRLHDYIT